MRITTQLAVIALSCLLASCTINPHPMDMTRAVQEAKTRSDHEALAKHYDEAAKEMQAKATEHKQIAAQYEANKTNYGKHTRTLVSHCKGLAGAYEQAAAENRSMAAGHRQLAAEAN